MWAALGHAACQRVFWLCDFAGEPGAEATPFPNAAHLCPGDDDLEHVLSAGALGEAFDSTLQIIGGCLGRWTLDMLDQEIRHPEWRGFGVYTRGSVIQRVFSHDVYHSAEGERDPRHRRTAADRPLGLGRPGSFGRFGGRELKPPCPGPETPRMPHRELRVVLEWLGLVEPDRSRREPVALPSWAPWVVALVLVGLAALGAVLVTSLLGMQA
jgi:hypothetical protein